MHEGNEDNEPRTLLPEVRLAIDDFEINNLAGLRGQFSQIIYLASLRDYNTGIYRHYGLETRYPREAVNEALRQCHEKVFEDLLALPLEDQTRDLLDFFESLKEDRKKLIKTWENLRSYQILPPEKCPPLARKLFEDNFQVMLRVLRETDLWALLHEPHSDADDLP